MGRPPKNPSHPLRRLRRAISTPSQIITREILAFRTGVPEPTIRDIENEKFRLTRSVALRIMLGTGVSIRSLLKDERPLRDITGKELSPQSRAKMVTELDDETEISMLGMLGAALKAAKEKKRSIVFYHLFCEWLPESMASIGATAAMKRELTRTLSSFNPAHVPEAFQPADPKMKQRWSDSWRERVLSENAEDGRLTNRAA